MLNLDQFEFRRRWPAIAPHLAQLAYEEFPQLTIRVLEIAAARLQSFAIPPLFSRDLREISPSLNDDLLDLLGRCERLLANQFTFYAHGEEFQAEIDWDVHRGTAWSTELHAFDYGLDLALNFRITADQRYARHLRYLMAQWIAGNPPGKEDGWSFGPLARRIRNWVLISDLARQDWEQDAEFLSLVNRSLALQSQFLLHFSPCIEPVEIKMDCGLALSFAAKYFSHGTSGELRLAGNQILLGVLANCFDRAGNPILSRPAIQFKLAQTLVECIAFRLTHERAAAELPDQLLLVLEVIAGALFPDGSMPLFGESALPPAEEFSDALATSAVLLNNPKWKSLAGKFGVMPYLILGEGGLAQFKRLLAAPVAPKSSFQPHAALHRLAGADSSAMVINARQASDSSEHQDGLSYELELAGQKVVVDSGILNPEPESQRQYYAKAEAHNVLLIDGAGPSAIESGNSVISAETWHGEPASTGLRLSHRGFSSLGFTHHRAWFKLEGNCWAVLDQLEGLGRHQATSLMHFFPTFQLEICPDVAVARSRSLALTIIPFGLPRVLISTSRGGEGNIQSWYSPAPGIRYGTSVLKLEWEISDWPWIGGYLIVPGTQPDFHSGPSGFLRREICFRLKGKDYRLPMAGRAGAWQKLT